MRVFMVCRYYDHLPATHCQCCWSVLFNRRCGLGLLAGQRTDCGVAMRRFVVFIGLIRQ